MLKTFTYRSGALILALSIMWIFSYALIEFHQKYVFGKYTEWVQFHLVKTGEKNLKKNLKSYPFSQKSNKTGKDQAGIPVQINQVVYAAFYFSGSIQIPQSIACNFGFNSGPSLRAPPAL